ncbi:MAG: hypothetical protein ACI9XO_003436 [Paraglaciecola sp.]
MIKKQLVLKKNLVILMVLPFLIFSCKILKKGEDIQLKKAKSEFFLLRKMVQNQVNAESLAAKARVTIRDESGVTKFTANFRWKKDSVIWMNFKKVSVEAARVKITPDSIFIIDRLNKKYVAEDFNFAQQEFNLPTGFDGLQAFLLGNPVFFTKDMKSDIDDNRYHLSGKTDTYETEYWLEAAGFLLRKIMVDDFRNGRTLEYDLGDYGKLADGQNFSYFRELNFSSREFGAMSVKMELSKVELNEVGEIRFSIPEHYERVLQ